MVAEGKLAIEDTHLAAVQFVDLRQATLMRPRLFNAIRTPPEDEEVRRVVGSAIEMFTARYGVKPESAEARAARRAAICCPQLLAMGRIETGSGDDHSADIGPADPAAPTRGHTLPASPKAAGYRRRAPARRLPRKEGHDHQPSGRPSRPPR